MVATIDICLTHIYGQITDVCFFYLLKIITSIIKANTTIVSATRPNKSKYIIVNKNPSIIVPPPLSSYNTTLSKWQPHLFIIISYVQHFTTFSSKSLHYL